MDNTGGADGEVDPSTPLRSAQDDLNTRVYVIPSGTEWSRGISGRGVPPVRGEIRMDSVLTTAAENEMIISNEYLNLV